MSSIAPPVLTKLPTGIDGFDQITHGGLPLGRTTLVLGGPGSGKTIFSLQTLVNGARFWGEPGIFVAFEENSRQIVANAATFGWDLPGLEREQLFFLDAHLSPDIVQAGQFDLTPILAALKAKAMAMGARRIVFDGIDVLLSLLDDPVAERREIYRLREWLTDLEMTGVVTAKVEGPDPMSSQRYGFLQFMADCVVVFHHRVEDRVSLRGVRVAKYRGSNHSANEFPMVISSQGMQAAGYSGAEVDVRVSEERVSSGVPRLDTMLGGGYYRGGSILVSGAPGTAKTTLCGLFVEAACSRGDRALFISFDEAADAIVRNLRSVGISLRPHLDSGLLRVCAMRAAAFSSEEHFVRINEMLEQHQPRALVVDPISALGKTGGRIAASNSTSRLVDLARERGITTIFTSLLSAGSANALAESTPSEISTIADTWIHLSYVIRGGERNRGLTVVKSRGAGHSNQVRELLLSDDGVTLADVYTASGEVLMGSARREKEAKEAAERAQRVREAQQRRRDLERSQAELRSRLDAIQVELETKRMELEALLADEEARQADEQRSRLDYLRGRQADADTLAAAKRTGAD